MERVVKRVMFVGIMSCVLQLANAATFVISNFSGDTVTVKPVWYRHQNQEIVLKKGESKKYDSGFNKVLQIVWINDNKRYTADLSSVSSQMMLNKQFIILEDGNYTTNIVSFPFKEQTKQAFWLPIVKLT